jgi:2-polyprenyl-6-methoxyphenol hydroxylase-like FAD-dependent oxidoreductase
MFRSAGELEYDHRDLDRQRHLLRAAFADLGWDVPRLLRCLDDADDFYFDAISQIRLDSWSRGRVTLVGDAGYCPGPAVGGGTSLAVVGAYVLAAELAAAGGDHVTGFPAYERAMAETVRQSHTVGPAVLRTLVPSPAPRSGRCRSCSGCSPGCPRRCGGGSPPSGAAPRGCSTPSS